MAPKPALTIFNSTHKNLDAKMIDFGGWDMPIHYGSQLSEHLHTRVDASLFDVSHMAVVDCFGSEVVDFLDLLLANNIHKLASPGRGFYTCMLNDSGGIIDDLIVYRLADRYRLVINASTAVDDLIWMRQLAAKFNHLEIVPRRADLEGCLAPEVLLAVQGPNALLALSAAFPALATECKELNYFHGKFLNTALGNIFLARTGYTGEDGFEISVPSEQGLALWSCLMTQYHTLMPAGLGARDTLRIEAGYNLYGQDMNHDTSPLDCGLAWTVDLKSARNFIGKHALLKRGQVSEFLGLVLLDKGILRSHQKVFTPMGDGEISSGTYSPSIEKSIGLAQLPMGQVLGSTVQVKIRDQLLNAVLVKPQFVRRGHILV